MNDLNKKVSSKKTKSGFKTAHVVLLAIIGVAAVVLVIFSSLDAPQEVTAEEAMAVLKEENIEVLSSLPDQQRQQQLKLYAKAIVGQHMAERNNGAAPGSGGRPERDDAVRKTLSKLSSEDRRAFREGVREVFREQMKKRIDDFFNATQEEQQRMLDEDIARFNQRRRPAETPKEAGKNDKAGDKSDARPRKMPSKDVREEHMRERLNDSTPAERAKIQEYFRRIRERRESSK